MTDEKNIWNWTQSSFLPVILSLAAFVVGIYGIWSQVPLTDDIIPVDTTEQLASNNCHRIFHHFGIVQSQGMHQLNMMLQLLLISFCTETEKYSPISNCSNIHKKQLMERFQIDCFQTKQQKLVSYILTANVNFCLIFGNQSIYDFLSLNQDFEAVKTYDFLISRCSCIMHVCAPNNHCPQYLCTRN